MYDAVVGPLRKYLSTSVRAAKILVLETFVYRLCTESEKETNIPLSSSRPKMAERILCRGNLFANWSTTGPAEGSSESEQVARTHRVVLGLWEKSFGSSVDLRWRLALVLEFASGIRTAPYLSRYSFVLPDVTRQKISYVIEITYVIFFLYSNFVLFCARNTSLL